jgi:hypothetical protein
MSVQPNIDRFNKAALLVFDKLYQAFPVPMELNASKIAMDTLPADATFDESFQSIEPVFYTIEFLQKEGFIEYGEQTLDGSSFLRARLTSKSLALLGQTPSALEPQVSISERIRSLVKGGVKEVSSEAAKKAVELLFTHGSSLISIGQSAASGGM